MKKDITIEEIEIIEGIGYDSKYESQNILPVWYKSIRSKKLSQLSDGDLARFIRQNLYLEHILFECINRLYKNPFSGEKYDGEIIEVLSNIDVSFWEKNGECKRYMNKFLIYFNSNVYIENYEELDDSEKDEILELINQLSRNTMQA